LDGSTKRIIYYPSAPPKNKNAAPKPEAAFSVELQELRCFDNPARQRLSKVSTNKICSS